jgi:hypothetical protein
MPIDIVYNSMPIKTVALSTGNATIDSANGYVYTKAGGTCTITFSAILELETIYFVFNSIGNNYNITWSAGSTGLTIRWPNSISPVMTITNGRKDIISFVRIGTDLIGSYILNT